jgi:hypothetical protein
MKTICEYFLVLITFIICSQSIAQDTNATITKINIEQAEKVIGLKLTDAERDSLISDAIENLKSYHTIRKIEIENSIPPAVLFQSNSR